MMKYRIFVWFLASAIGCFPPLAAATKFCTQHGQQIYAAQDRVANALYEADKAGGRLFRQTYTSRPRELAHKQVLYKNTYSDLSKVLKEFLAYCEAPGTDILLQGWQDISNAFDALYTECLSKHRHTGAYLGRGHLRYDNGDYAGCACDLTAYCAGTSAVDAEVRLMLAASHNTLLDYSKAITVLSNTADKEALYHRAVAHFESGAYDDALSDFLKSEKAEQLANMPLKASPEFASGLQIGLRKSLNGSFISSRCYSLRGINQILWRTTDIPTYAMNHFANACLQAVIATIPKTSSPSELEVCDPNLRHLHRNFSKMTEQDRGLALGQLLSKYGVEIFSLPLTLQGAQIQRTLHEANATCLFEAMTTDEEFLKVAASDHFAKRCSYFENAIIDQKRQGIVASGKRKGNRCTFTHHDANGLLKKFAGKGQPIHDIPSPCDYRERVDFGQIIGDYSAPRSHKKVETSWGEIHYTKDGAIIIPVMPV